ncbi:MAG: YceI family protein [Calditrichaeota bacterium]|nr:MAG: YceI family protein [Calditrichota bacterium]
MRFHSLKLVIILLFSASLHAGEWQVDKKANNSVIFSSTTTLLDFQGKTSAIDGYYYNEGDSLFGEKNELYFEVQLATFDTGNGKRDRDMREDVLETDKHPLSFFKGTISKVHQAEEGYTVTAVGDLSLHGIVQKMAIIAQVVEMDNGIKISSAFSFLLKDFKIAAPSLLAFVKVAEKIEIEVNFELKIMDKK